MRRLLCFALLFVCWPLPASAQTRLAVIVVAFPDSESTPYDPVAVTQATLQDVAAYYASQSYGQFIFQGDTFGVFTIPRPVDPETSFDARQHVAASAKQAASTAGVDLSAYSSFVYVLPITTFIGGGFGDNSGVWIALSSSVVAAPGFQILAHELGHHFFGWNHDQGSACTGALRSGTCETRNQGDSLSVMGHGNGHVSPLAKQQAGWLSPITVTQGGDYLIAPYDGDGGVRALRVIGGTNKLPTHYILTFRPSDAASSLVDEVNVQTGVVVHLTNPQAPSILWGMNPTETLVGGRNTHPALTVGQVWCEAGRSLSVVPLSVGPSGIIVRIDTRRCK